MAVRPRGRRRGRGAHMREKEMRADVAAELAQVLVRPGGTDLAVEPWLGMLAVPAQSEAVPVGGRRRFEGANALLDQRVGRGGDVVLQRNRFTAIGNPSAHGRSASSGGS